MSTTGRAVYTDFSNPNKPEIRARLLHERSFLMFEYYGAKDQVTRAHLPFLQNISISEDGKSNLVNYNLLGRAGQLFAYTGSDSRKLKLDFEMSLQHLFHLQETEGITERFKQTIKNKDVDAERKRFTYSSALRSPVGAAAYDYGHREKVKFLKSLGLSLPRAIALEKNDTRHSGRRGTDFYAVDNPDTDKVINLMMFWINLIRSSILNDSRNTVFGPPIVRLNHGPMYMNSPCLVEDYKISVDKTSNYDLETLLPHTIKVSMSLIESRAGDFGGYATGDRIEGDNLTGWESIINENVLDAMNYNVETEEDT